MERKPVESSNIKSVGYDFEKMLLEVEFYNGAVYEYHPITQDGYNLLMEADSIGGFFHQHIRNNKLITAKKVSR